MFGALKKPHKILVTMLKYHCRGRNLILTQDDYKEVSICNRMRITGSDTVYANNVLA